MKFHGKAGQELRTWILFFVGIFLVGFFAWQKNPLNPWWTLIIGAFTCTAIIVSAVQALVGGMSDAARRAIDEQTRTGDNHADRPDKPDEKAFSVGLGDRGSRLNVVFRPRYAVAI